MIIYGGISLSEEILGDIWNLDLITLQWHLIEEKQNKNIKTAYMASALVIDSERAKNSNITIYKFPELPKRRNKVLR